MIDFLQYDFMIRALAAGIAIALIAPMIGTFLVMRRYAYMADTLAHIALVGVALGLLLNINPVIAAVVITIVAALGIEQIRQNKKILSEAVLALFLSGSLAIAIVLVNLGHGVNTDLASFLFGSIATVAPHEVAIIIILGIVALTVILIFYKEFFLVTFDEELAYAEGLPTKTFNTLLVMLAGIAVALAMRIVGILLIGALMVIPVTTAIQFGRSFRQTFLIAILLSLTATITGLVLSYFLDLAPGGTIVIIALIFFIFSLFTKR
ncbi:MAG: metal ABC transporter permease [Candidatus Kerfeldbacteria bacterium RIFCSPHIGHO2_02_FULL_42_14]|uniref:Metal ABC transporter permease n=1 Tax=Candidatus Kerfeldbacteria bacterium RIFCSPHIGHO2_02_FULL_42_14 TaxID=1798540 RepID=A0A1G2AS61_9BACT|nr:MAG: metal ABC transporter permease [Candidatus Kerfeldbacteria bacterium RIFCSPHIGHO2_02_FULL_42_14]OGY81897.1 MAG: metal ABC transporter permease [Candidatus Kerfeldbacteria bacterium RIFCSPHIGHO2_12_FULL_42_13]OGY83468.1 MAG: metal ABC transporter permease [Candidatus Kerfeldbacteria bacterium RIFCSPLOWO2_02_FULL_42_19]